MLEVAFRVLPNECCGCFERLFLVVGISIAMNVAKNDCKALKLSPDFL